MGDKADIIFSSLPVCLDLVARILRKFGHNVFYISLSNADSPSEAEKQRASRLRETGVLPLPLELLPRLSGIRRYASDPDKKLQGKVNELVPVALLRGFEDLYPNNANVVIKLRAIVQEMAAEQFATANKTNLWARAHPGRKHLLVYPDVYGLVATKLDANVGLLVVPVETFFKAMRAAAQVVRRVLRTVVHAAARSRPQAVPVSNGSRDVSTSRVAFVTHEGLSYGDLFEKTLLYSDRADSERHPANLLHFDYSGFPSPSENIKWVCLGSQRQSLFSNLYHGLIALSRGIPRVRGAHHFLGVLLLTRIYVSFVSYSRKLEDFPALRVALIDYDILCPKALLLAFESRNIKTVAAQERFFAPFYATVGTILNTYLCGSEHIARVMRESSLYCVDHYLPVGQYRSDSFAAAQRPLPPRVLEGPLAQGRKIITALGFHTHLDWYNSQTDPLLNWSGHRLFLEEMIRLSREIPGVYIVLRFKFVDWVSLPVFADAVREIQASENIAISMDYEMSLFSYALCANSHLVIAKHTSLADECLAAGIPVLFHEYTHNTERLMADAFDYSPARIMCFNYQELLERTHAILGGAPNAMTSDYEYLKNVVFGGLGDGKVRARIHAHIDALLA